ncbi:hypothetical protein GOP47_0006883, partial [Adiantum capillus-veneris]
DILFSISLANGAPLPFRCALLVSLTTFSRNGGMLYCKLKNKWRWHCLNRVSLAKERVQAFSSAKEIAASAYALQPAIDRPRLYQAYRRETMGWMPRPQASHDLPYLLQSEVQALHAVLAEGKWNSRVEKSLSKSVVTLTPLHILDTLKLQENLRIAFRFFIWSVQQQIYETQSGHACCRRFLRPCDFIIRRIAHMQRFDEAWLVLKGMHKKEVPIPSEAFTVMIKSYGLHSMVNEALETLHKMADFSCKPALATLNAALAVAVKANLVNEAEKIYHKALSEGLRPDKVTFNSLLLGLGQGGKLQEARVLLEKFAEMLHFPDRVAYTSLIAGLSKAGLMDEALIILDDMQKAGESPDIVTYSAVMDGFCKLGMFEKAMKLFSELGARRCVPNVFSYSILIDALCKEGKLDDAYRFFDEMLDHCCIPTIVTYNTLINGLCKAHKLKEAWDLFQDATRKGCTPAVETYNILISAYCSKNQLSNAFKLFHKMWRENCRPDTVTFNSIIHGLCKLGRARRGYNLLQRMVQKGCPPTTITYNTVLDGFCKEGNLEEAKRLLLRMDKEGVKKDAVTNNTLMALLLKVGNVNGAFETLRELLQNGFVPNVVTFNTFLSSLGKREELMWKDVINMLELMPAGCFIIDSITIHVLIQDFCTAKRISLACDLLNELSLKRFTYKGEVYSQVICALSDHERIELAYTVVINQLADGWMPEPVSCARLIEGLCTKNDTDTAFQLFQNLTKAGFSPNSKSAVTLLTSLKQEGKAEECNQIIQHLKTEKLCCQ